MGRGSSKFNQRRGVGRHLEHAVDLVASVGIIFELRDVGGHILITITDRAGPNAVLSGLFFDPTGTSTASFLEQDATTQGSWIDTYGAQGYDVIRGAVSLPSYATVTPSGNTTLTSAAQTDRPRALQVPGRVNSIASGWYAPDSFTVRVNLTDGQQHDLDLYFLDWMRLSRVEQVQISDAITGGRCSTPRVISSFGEGVYLDYIVSGNILITITKEAGPNATLNGLFFDPTTTSGPLVLKQSATAQNGPAMGANVAPAYDVINGAVGLPGYAALPASGQSSGNAQARKTSDRSPRASRPPAEPTAVG